MNNVSPNPVNVRDAMRRIQTTRKAAYDLTNDPATYAYHTPVGDFIAAYRRIERTCAAYIIRHSPPGTRRFNRAMHILEGYMP